MRLMLVDDDSMVREVMAGELEARGFVVTTACDGPAALALLDTGQVIDLVITDYAMPKMDGLTLIRQMRQRRPNLPALLLTGYAEGTAEVSLSEAQNRLTVLLRKPIGGDELATRILAFRRTRS
jgi:CheY-like chemotaxis protein